MTKWWKIRCNSFIWFSHLPTAKIVEIKKVWFYRHLTDSFINQLIDDFILCTADCTYCAKWELSGEDNSPGRSSSLALLIIDSMIKWMNTEIYFDYELPIVCCRYWIFTAIYYPRLSHSFSVSCVCVCVCGYLLANCGAASEWMRKM